MISNARDRFQSVFGREPDAVASAPGRLEIIGNHTDYNGGQVVGAAIDRRLVVALRRRPDDLIRLVSDTEETTVETQLGDVSGPDVQGWIRYPLGVLQEARSFHGLHAANDLSCSGFELMVTGRLPSGAGLSSSAALEMATAFALDTLFGWEFTRDELILIAHRAETEFVGVPCGKLDQNVVGLAKKQHFVALDHATGAHNHIPVPDQLSFVVIPTHVSHRLADSPYAVRRMECEQALQALRRMIPGISHVAHLRRADLIAYRDLISGAMFNRCLHVVEENDRVKQFVKLVTEGRTDSAGKLLFESHESSRTLFENSTPELDHIVESMSGRSGVLGARLTGAGFGGAVLALVSSDFTRDELAKVRTDYRIRFDFDIDPWPARTDDGARIEV